MNPKAVKTLDRRLAVVGLLLIALLSCATATAAFVAVEWGGRVTFSELGHRRGTRVTGYFIYDSGRPSGPQTTSPPNVVFEMTDGTYFERSSYNFYVYNNWSPPGESVLRDGFALEFSYPGGYGSFSLMSSNTSLFTNNMAPPTIPALEQFDAGRALYLTVDQMQPYRSMAVEIDHLSVVLVVPGHPVIFGVGRRAGGVSFRFLTEPLTGYTVQFTNNLAAANWATLTNIGTAMEPIVLINDTAPKLENRFYRIQQQ